MSVNDVGCAHDAGASNRRDVRPGQRRTPRLSHATTTAAATASIKMVVVAARTTPAFVATSEDFSRAFPSMNDIGQSSTARKPYTVGL